MSAGRTPDFEETRRSINAFFEQQLKDLGLSEDSLYHQTEEELHRSLVVIDQAIENHEAFGKLAIRLTAESVMVVVAGKTESHFEVGVLPLLLQRKQIILHRLGEFANKNSISDNDFNTRNLNIQRELERIAKGEMTRRLWAAVVVLIGVWVLLFVSSQ